MSCEIYYCEKSGKFLGGMSIRFYNKQKITQYVDLKDKKIKLFLPFKGKEKVCWDCGFNRELVIELDINGNYLGQKETCDNS